MPGGRLGIVALGALCVTGLLATPTTGVDALRTFFATTSTTTMVPATTTTIPAPVGVNPFTVPLEASYLENRVNLVTAAVYDARSGKS